MTLSEELIARARAIAPIAAREAHNTDLNRRLSDEVIDACCDAGLMQILVPRKYGGHELDYTTMAAVISEFARHCTSTAWVLSFYMGHNYIHSLFPEGFQNEVFADRPYALTPGTVAPNFKLAPVDGGFIANGASQWNSGSSRADWFLAGGLITGDGQPRGPIAFMAPSAEVEIIDNWDVAGMRGTSSGDIRMTDVFVPQHRIVPVMDLLNGQAPGAKLHANRIYSLPLLPFILGETVPVTVGAYRGAADAFKTLTEERFSVSVSSKVQDRQAAQMRMGQAQAGAAIAEQLMHDYARLLDGVEPDAIKSIERRAELRAHVAMITNYCHDGIHHLMLGAGGGAFRNSSPLQRFFRDISVLRVHGFLDLETATEALGRVQLGLDAKCPL